MAKATRAKKPKAVRPHVCGNVEQLGDGSPSLKLATNRPLVYVESAPPGWTKADVWSWMEEAHARWSAVCDWKVARIADVRDAGPNDYVQLVTAADLGGGGVLADQVLPYAGGNILRMRLNTRVKWKPTDGPMASGTIDPVRTVCHETGHFMGHQHWPQGAPPELMEPYITQTVLGPQPTEGKVSAGWFGDPVAVPPAPPAGQIVTTDFGRRVVTAPAGWVLQRA